MLTVSANKKVSIAMFFVALFILLTWAKSGQADSYVVTASVPYATPTQTATITTPGTTVVNSRITINGTCQPIIPDAIVSIWRGATLLGSTTCQANGTFSLAITLQSGVNNVLPRTSNILNVYGPDGPTIAFTYNPAEQPAQPQNNIAVPTPATAAPTTALEISSQQPFGVLNSSGGVLLNVTVEGGETPYNIVIRWGDGAVQTLTVASPGTYSFEHTYKQKKDYIAVVRIVDKNGVSSDFAIPFLEIKGVTAKNSAPSVLPAAVLNTNSITVNLYLLSAFIAAVVIGAFIIGKQHQIRHHKKAAIKRRPNKSKK